MPPKITVRGATPAPEVRFEPVVQRDDVQHVQVLPLVLVQPLHLDVEERLRVHDDTGALLDERGQSSLVLGLDRLPLRLETGIGCQRLEALELVFQVRDPSIADSTGDERAQLRIAQHDPAPRRHAVGDVEELLRREPVEVAEHGLLEELGMERRHAVDRVTADAGEMGHAHVFLPGLVDRATAAAAVDRHPGYEGARSPRKRWLIS